MIYENNNDQVSTVNADYLNYGAIFLVLRFFWPVSFFFFLFHSYFLQLFEVLFDIPVEVIGSSQLIGRLLQSARVNSTAFALRNQDRARFQSGLKLHLKAQVFAFQVLVLFQEGFDFIL